MFHLLVISCDWQNQIQSPYSSSSLSLSPLVLRLWEESSLGENQLSNFHGSANGQVGPKIPVTLVVLVAMPILLVLPWQVVWPMVLQATWFNRLLGIKLWFNLVLMGLHQRSLRSPFRLADLCEGHSESKAHLMVIIPWHDSNDTKIESPEGDWSEGAHFRRRAACVHWLLLFHEYQYMDTHAHHAYDNSSFSLSQHCCIL